MLHDTDNRSATSTCARIEVIDTHTGGEPTRIVLRGGPDLGKGSLEGRRRRLFCDRHDGVRAAIVDEPRGFAAMVGALLVDPVDAGATAGVLFFNSAGPLGMCGHGAIGVAVALGHLGWIAAGEHLLETPVGSVAVRLHDDLHRVTVENVASYRFRKDVNVAVPGVGNVRGDIAWGGNWFFLVDEPRQSLEASRIGPLTSLALEIRNAMERQGIRGEKGATVDHVEFHAPPASADADSRNFVLCPSGAWDRSPCGTGTSARLACLAADGLLPPGKTWRQESLRGSLFEATYRQGEGATILPSITGTAYVTAQATLLIDPRDPFRGGISR